MSAPKKIKSVLSISYVVLKHRELSNRSHELGQASHSIWSRVCLKSSLWERLESHQLSCWSDCPCVYASSRDRWLCNIRYVYLDETAAWKDGILKCKKEDTREIPTAVIYVYAAGSRLERLMNEYMSSGEPLVLLQGSLFGETSNLTVAPAATQHASI